LLLLSGFSLGVVATLILIVARDFGRLEVARAFIAFLLAGACFLVQPHIPDSWRPLADSLSTMVPALFWLLCQLAFSYRPKIMSFFGALALYTFLAPGLSRILGLERDGTSHWELIGWVIPTYCEYIIISLGIWTVIANWEDDLVESSRRLRGAVLIIAGVCVILVVVPLNTGIVGRWLPFTSASFISLIASYFLLMGRPGVLFGVLPTKEEIPEPVAVSDTKEPDAIQEVDTQALTDIMDKGFYRTEHLTLKLLAGELGMPEYKTRALINQTLGYRNFNDYINQLRIQEAAHRLLKEPDTPILNISLDVGYRTLSSFNRAFKDIQAMTPSEYRLQAQQLA
jgi:AraC-like DNA-binding protein